MLYKPKGRLKALPVFLALVITVPFNSFLKPSQLPAEYTASATNMQHTKLNGKGTSLKKIVIIILIIIKLGPYLSVNHVRDHHDRVNLRVWEF